MTIWYIIHVEKCVKQSLNDTNIMITIIAPPSAQKKSNFAQFKRNILRWSRMSN